MGTETKEKTPSNSSLGQLPDGQTETGAPHSAWSMLSCAQLIEVANTMTREEIDNSSEADRLRLTACNREADEAARTARERQWRINDDKPPPGPAGEIFQKILRKYKIRPKRYRGLFDGSNLGEARFIQVLPKVVAFINQRMAAAGCECTVDEAEIATNALAEGMVELMSRVQAHNVAPEFAPINGYRTAGIDTIVDKYEDKKSGLRTFLSPDLEEILKSGNQRVSIDNELGQNVRSLDGLTFEQAVYGNAAMYAQAKVQADRDLRHFYHVRINDLNRAAQHYWSAAYYNNPGIAKANLQTMGVTFSEAGVQQDTQLGGAKHDVRNVHYNASWRTATYEFLSQTVLRHGSMEQLEKDSKRKVDLHTIQADILSRALGLYYKGFYYDYSAFEPNSPVVSELATLVRRLEHWSGDKPQFFDSYLRDFKKYLAHVYSFHDIVREMLSENGAYETLRRAYVEDGLEPPTLEAFGRMSKEQIHKERNKFREAGFERPAIRPLVLLAECRLADFPIEGKKTTLRGP